MRVSVFTCEACASARDLPCVKAVNTSIDAYPHSSVCLFSGEASKLEGIPVWKKIADIECGRNTMLGAVGRALLAKAL